MKQFHNLVKRILREGEVAFEPRTKMNIIGIPGHQAEYNLKDGFPLMTTKNVPLRLPGEEVFWKARGERDVKSLVDRNLHFWTANAFDKHLKTEGRHEEVRKHTLEWDEEFKAYSEVIMSGSADDPMIKQMSDLGPVYGFQWRHGFKRDGEEIDQLKNAIEGIKRNPVSRYHLLNAWNPSDMADQALPPCPMTHQFTSFGGPLHLHVYQRSCDTYLGVPFNIAQDALLLEMVAKETGNEPGKLVHTTSNTHVYLGVDRGDFWKNESAVAQFRGAVANPRDLDAFLKLRDWYVKEAGLEQEANERKDHMPFVLEQLSKEHRPLSRLELEDMPFFEAIQQPLGDVARVLDYNPHKWDAKAAMAA
jgi:thymidylate synthase